jgi:hypothetical protein
MTDIANSLQQYLYFPTLNGKVIVYALKIDIGRNTLLPIGTYFRLNLLKNN